MGKQRITKKQKETIFIYRALSVRIFAFIMLLEELSVCCFSSVLKCQMWRNGR